MRVKGQTDQENEKQIQNYIESIDNKGVENFARLMESEDANDIAQASRSVVSRKIRAMSMIARGMRDKEIMAILNISQPTLSKYKKDAAVQRGITSIQAKIVQKTELIVDSVSEKRIEVATEAQQVLREMMLNQDNPLQVRLKCAQTLVEPLTRYYQPGSQTQTLSFAGSDPTVLMDDLAEIKAIFCRKKIKASNDD